MGVPRGEKALEADAWTNQTRLKFSPAFFPAYHPWRTCQFSSAVEPQLHFSDATTSKLKGKSAKRISWSELDRAKCKQTRNFLIINKSHFPSVLTR
jgi:hypothetical protein